MRVAVGKELINWFIVRKTKFLFGVFGCTAINKSFNACNAVWSICLVVGFGVLKKERIAWFNWFIICNNSCC